jgi:ATP-dependent Clp protease ATP-binding subunit ClpA
MKNADYIYSNQLMKALLSCINEARQRKKTSIDIYMVFESVVLEKKSLANKIFQEIYPDSNQILKNFKNLVLKNQKNIEKNTQKKDISFTPLVRNLLFITSIKFKKSSKIITTKDLFILLIKHKRIKHYLELARKRTKNPKS